MSAKGPFASSFPTCVARILLTFALVAFMLAGVARAQDALKPNIIFILADDLGYGDVSCYGQKHFQTPNIDRLAGEGMRFTAHYAGSPVCAPSRCALMTGQHSGHGFVRGNKEVNPEGQLPLPADAHTLTKMLKSQGYTTGVFGKWGLGYPGSEGSPEHQGVDVFFGYNCQRLAHNYYPTYLWDNERKVTLQGNTGNEKNDYSALLIHQHALRFLEENKAKPFFLFYTMTLPHAELVAPEKYLAAYRGKFLPERSYAGVDSGPKFRKGPYGSQEEAHAAFAAMVTLIDEIVGDVMQKVSDLGLDNNTIIVFSSDNGPHMEGGADPDYFDSNGIYRGYKRDVYEGGIRVPLIFRWKGTIAPGTTSDHVSAFWDIMPTFADLLKIKLKGKTDGISFLPTLTGNARKQREHKNLYWEFHEQGGRMALREGDWKLVWNNVDKVPNGTPELYNLKDDPSETRDLASTSPDKVKKMKKEMLEQHLPSKEFPFTFDK